MSSVRGNLLHSFFKVGKKILRSFWECLPRGVISSPPFHLFGKVIHRVVVRFQGRKQSDFTRFMRNIPLLEVIRDLVADWPHGANLQIASVGCSYGAELYSALSFIRSSRPDLKISACGTDISPAAVAKAEAGIFMREDKELEWISETTIHELFDDEGGKLVVKPRLREGARWFVGDAMNPELPKMLGPQDILLANNFMGPMDETDAEKCLANLYHCVKPDAYLIIDGVDLDLRTRFVRDHNLAPVSKNIEAIHLGDKSKLGWPWDRWGAEPLEKKDGWQIRYAAVFQIPR